MDIFKEIENDVLMLSFENKTDGNCDLIFLFLDENFNFGNFRISESQKVLSSENKSIISNLAYNSTKAILENNKINGNAYKTISTKFVSVIKQSNMESESENKFQKLYQKTIEEYLRKTLDKLSKNNQNFRFEISENALTKLKTYEGSLENLNKIIKTAAFYAVNLNNNNENTIIIEETFIDLNVKDETKAVTPISTIDRYSKTILILDKLEKAAQEVIERELDITSANVGNACANPISAPAITDALKKHRNKILVLLKKYPDNWKLIRNEFKPIRNLIASENQFKEQTA
ncbi:MAG: hypothetical protein HXX09_16645 [Bacteroidetes bacterium]|nr:hypothetical protein [Bacteroidota bacterium]